MLKGYWFSNNHVGSFDGKIIPTFFLSFLPPTVFSSSSLRQQKFCLSSMSVEFVFATVWNLIKVALVTITTQCQFVPWQLAPWQQAPWQLDSYTFIQITRLIDISSPVSLIDLILTQPNLNMLLRAMFSKSTTCLGAKCWGEKLLFYNNSWRAVGDEMSGASCKGMNWHSAVFTAVVKWA